MMLRQILKNKQTAILEALHSRQVTSPFTGSTKQKPNQFFFSLAVTMPTELRAPVNTNSRSKKSLYPLPLYDKATHQHLIMDIATKFHLPNEVVLLILPIPAKLKKSNEKFKELSFQHYRSKKTGDGKTASPFLLQTLETWKKTDKKDRLPRELINYDMGTPEQYTGHSVVRQRPDDWPYPTYKRAGKKLPYGDIWAFAILLDMDGDTLARDFVLKLYGGCHDQGDMHGGRLNASGMPMDYYPLEWEVKAWKGRETRVWWIRKEGDPLAGSIGHQSFWRGVEVSRHLGGGYWNQVSVEMEGVEGSLGVVDVYRAELAIYLR